jgi:hypothetical protein
MAKRSAHFLFALLFAAGIACAPRAFAEQPSEYEIKAAFLYNFAKFVTWPASKFADDDSPIVIGILGKDPFGDVIDESVKEKTIGGRPLRVERIQDVRETKGVHLLFFGELDEAELERASREIDRAGLLIVGEVENFASRNGMIGLFMEENRVRFEVNIRGAESAGLKISSKLLQLARVVGNEGTGGR